MTPPDAAKFLAVFAVGIGFIVFLRWVSRREVSPRVDSHGPGAVDVRPSELCAIDGDTFRLRRRRLRLLGVDAPETALSGQAEDAEEAFAGAEARDFARYVLRRARRVRVIYSGRQDRYGRDLVDIEVDGVDFAELLREHGFDKPV